MKLQEYGIVKLENKKEKKMFKLDVPYHTQRNNKLFPYSTCGTTCIAMVLDYLNKAFNKKYACDDDAVFEALNSQDLINRAKAYINNGDKWIETYLNDKRFTPGGKIYTHLNNVAVMLGEVGSYLTKNEFVFKLKYRTFKEISDGLVNDKVPYVTSGMFTKSGHYVAIIGVTNDSLIFNDPYGNWLTQYKDDKGAGMIYSLADLKVKAKFNTDSILTIKPVKTS